MILLDTNIIARLLEPGCPHHQPALDAIALLHARQESIAICSQNLVEFYAVACRTRNGLGMTPNEALTEIAGLKARFQVLPDRPVFALWEQLTAKYLPANKRVFDVRPVAEALVGGCSAILTFNDADFANITELKILNPFDVLQIPRV